jgi:hypothetical protein
MLTCVPETPANRLARIAKSRRHELGLTHTQIQAAGGPSPGTQQKIENARAGRFRDDTIADVERGLRWAPGSVQAVLDGGDPTPIEDFAVRHVVSEVGAPVVQVHLPSVPMTEIQFRELEALAHAVVLQRLREMGLGE